MSTGASTRVCGRFPLRELTGIEENGVAHTGSAAAIELLDRLIERTGGGAERWSAKQLTASERDRALLEVLRMTRGLRIESTLTCTACRVPFDVSFSAADLMPAGDPRAATLLPDGTFE